MEFSKSSEKMVIPDSEIKVSGGRSKERMITMAIFGIGVILFIVGIVLIAVATADKNETEKSAGNASTDKQGQTEETTAPPTEATIATTTTTKTPLTTTTQAPSGQCDFSEEAQRVELGEFLSRVKATYYKLHPYEVYWNPDATLSEIRQEFVAYDPTPSVIKNRTDTALELLKEISDTKIIADALQPRERKALAQVKHYLQHIFGQPYDVNYYAGDWMLGPNLFCWQEICYHGYAVHNGIGLHHKPYNASDVELIEKKLKTHKAGILQYIENMKMGVRKGMVRSIEECEAGINTIKRQYLNVSRYNATGKEIGSDSFSTSFVAQYFHP